jgi:hypothetical protein
VKTLTISMVGALLAVGSAACALDFDRFESRTGLSVRTDGGSADEGGGDGATAVDDAEPADAGAPLDDASVATLPDAQGDAGPCVPSADCLTTAASCDIGCAQDEQTCASKCMSSSSCRSRCTRTQSMCAMQCTTTCSSCTQSAGCSAIAACSSAGR